jgi:hypothetical protein
LDTAAPPSGLAGDAGASLTPRPHLIELDVAGTSVFIWRGAELAMVSTIIGALKAAK